MILLRTLKWLASAVLAIVIVAVLFIALFGWNWLRAPLERQVLAQTGRVLSIQGDLSVHLGWPWPRLQAAQVTFANPAWAAQANMLKADEVALSVHLPQLLAKRLVVSDLHLVKPLVFLERHRDGRKTWLLDRQQQDENARIDIDRFTLDQGVIGFDDVASQTSLRAELSSLAKRADDDATPGVSFNAKGKYQGLPLVAKGTGDSVLALRDDSTPYGLSIDATVGHTHVRAEGHITSLLKFSAIDMQLALSGDNLNQLFTLTGIALPATRDYVTHGHLLRKGNTVRYESFTGRVGTSDLSGWLQVKTGGKRPLLTADLVSNRLTLEDLGPVIGARPGKVQSAIKAVAQTGAAGAVTPTSKRVMPDIPFKFSNWDTLDADVQFSAKSIRKGSYMPLDALSTHLSLKDAVLTLDPLQFGVAGGQLVAAITLDGRHNPIRAKAELQLKRLALAKLLPADQKGVASSSLIGGQIKLAGTGNSVGSMLAHADGSVALLMSGGQISQMTMEKAGLHLWEIFRLTLTGDKQIKLRCAVANFDVKAGDMHANTLLLDTEVTTLLGSGHIDLAQEKLDLTLTQKTKNTSPLSLRSPIHITGNFAKPVIRVDQNRMAARALGALALGVINPLLALIPLIDAGPGKDSDCVQWLQGKK
ncbi:MAG: AsmA family protein [Rhodoferax sp.]|nr:AsmA family protein [Rhodoferax sp.]MDP1530203.1 AsmA family protein [Rhodoferax sp.]MDP1943451.1 AsmA family protein [Rhodoferax sp.]MDP2441360.1 AsmA family protein [Rhodoferax sp.]MDZ4207222.1 AsmA family protein [Rhodoferax sp.]